MALRGVKPAEIKKRLKMFVYGASGSGKTMASIQFPHPYIIDTEKGCENEQYVKLINNVGGVLFQSCDFDDVIAEIRELLRLKHDYKTLVIDPITIIYDNLVEKFSVRNGKDNTGRGRHYNEANKRMKSLFNLLLRLDMNIIITSHAKDKYVIGDNKEDTKDGQTYDCYKKMDYLFDLLLEVSKVNKKSYATVIKTRLSGQFEDGDKFPFSYDEFVKRYNREMLEKVSEPKDLASEKQISDLEDLIMFLKVPSDTIDKWLAKAESNSFLDMPSDTIQKCIEHLEKIAQEKRAKENATNKWVEKKTHLAIVDPDKVQDEFESPAEEEIIIDSVPSDPIVNDMEKMYVNTIKYATDMADLEKRFKHAYRDIQQCCGGDDAKNLLDSIFKAKEEMKIKFKQDMSKSAS